jgi:hypothetical protein
MLGVNHTSSGLLEKVQSSVSKEKSMMRVMLMPHALTMKKSQKRRANLKLRRWQCLIKVLSDRAITNS